MPSNTAAWLTEKQAKSLEVKDASYPSAGKGQVVIKVRAVAINPVDPKVQSYGIIVEKYPNVLGEDIAGEVVEVGEGISDLKVGDRVLGHTAGLMTQDPAQAGFQNYSVLNRPLVSQIPDSMSFETASVLPLGVATAAAGLYQKDFLNLQRPTTSAKSNGKVVIVFGGSSSVGSCAIQLLKASGYDVVATASKRNFKYCEDLGASAVVDYSSDDVVEALVKALEGKELAGVYDSISSADTVKVAVATAAKSKGEKKVATTNPGTDKASADGVTVKPVFATTIMTNDVGPAVFIDYLPKALADGSFLAKPDANVFGTGLDKIQGAIDKLKAGVSATKIVVTI